MMNPYQSNDAPLPVFFSWPVDQVVTVTLKGNLYDPVSAKEVANAVNVAVQYALREDLFGVMLEFVNQEARDSVQTAIHEELSLDFIPVDVSPTQIFVLLEKDSD